MFTRSGAGHQDGGGNPGHRNRPDSERSPGQRRRVGLETRQPLATIDGQGRRQRHSPAPALATGDGGGNPWPPSTGKADASDIHPLRRWPPGRRWQPWPPSTGKIPSVHQGNGGGLGWKHGNPGHRIDGQGRRQRHVHPLRRWPPGRRRQPWPPSTGKIPSVHQGNGGGLGWKHGNPGHHRRARPTPATFTRSGAGHRRRRRQPWPPSTGKIPSVHQGNGGGLGWKHGNPGHHRRARPTPATTRLALATDGARPTPATIHPLRRWPPETAAATLATETGKIPSVHQGNGGGLGWKHGNPGHHRRARPTPATFTRSGAGHQDGGGNPGHRRGPSAYPAKGWLGALGAGFYGPYTPAVFSANAVATRFAPPAGKIPSVHQGNGGCAGVWAGDAGGNPGHRNGQGSQRSPGQRAGWAGNAATLATIDGQGRRQRHSPAPALATRTAAATLATERRRVGLETRQPWPPETGKADASDVHPLRRWPPGRNWPPKRRVPSVHQGNAGLGWKHGNPWPPSTGKADASDIHPLRRWPPETAAATLGHHRRARPTPAMFTRSGAGHRRRRRQRWPPKRARFRAFTRATAAGWAGNTATLGHHRRARPTPATFTRSGAGHRRRRRQPLATIDGQGRRQRCSPAPALATRTAAATLATIDGQDSQRSPGQRRRVGLKTRQPWPPSTGKADASDIHPLRRWPPSTAAATLATETGQIPSVHQGNGGGLGWKHGNPGHHRRARPTPAMFTRSGAGHQDGGGHRRRRRQPWPPKRARFPAFTRATRRVGSETRQPWPPETGKADASDIHPLRRWPIPETPAATLATETGKVPSVHQGNGGGLGWKHGNPGHRRRARPTPATFTRSGAGHQDGGGNPGHHRRARFPAFTRATAAGWAGNTATLATIDGQGRRQRRSPAPALATIDGGGNPGHRNRPDSERSPGQRRRVGLETRQPWPPSTGKADASDVHPLRRWPPSTAAATLATETGQIPSVHQGNAAGWAENTATLATIDGQGRRQRRSPAPALATIDGGGNPGHRNRPDSERSPGQRRRGSAAQVRNPPIVRAYFATTQPLGRCCRVR